MIVSDVIAKSLKKEGIKDIFMLTGYGAMYLNDSIEKEGIKYIAARNEAAAPMMAEAYAKAKNSVGAVCVTAGPGATNALPGLAEAYVDSTPIVVISGQVENINTADYYKKLNIRTLGTAEFSITRILKNITKYSVKLTDPNKSQYEIEKAIHISKTGRPGPVWIEIPLDIQSKKVIKNKLKKFKPKYKQKNYIKLYKKIYFKLLNSKKPLFAIGNGLKQSGSKDIFNKIQKKLNIPYITTRFANDIFPHKNKLNLGLCGIKGLPHTKKITEKCDLLIGLGCRFAPTFCMGNPKNFAKKAYTISINNDQNELNLNLKKIDLKINGSLFEFLSGFYNYIKKTKKINFKKWENECLFEKKNNYIPNIYSKKEPIDLYKFMYELDDLSPSNSILITDAGSNYYIGGQAWNFNKGQIEISSSANAAMGLSLPLSIGASVAKKNNVVLSVTGDGSIELNIQELKTISHYKLNIKTFVINNGGYVSMKKWQGNFFDGNILDSEDQTGVGTLNFKKIANAFDLNYLSIKKISDIKKIIKKILKNKKPYLIEVFTDPNQKIYGKEF
ncbi:thiamine pyrophosphate-binding protein [Candidatus Pelagibacter communis]|uniref:thiamine pyrophosphate-binding protein n=1 Tax=Pelagibacter ubique TaxID=198252 RepID=UPI00094D7D81|nr:thiamine pyrophosphate-binding protein [Candidatus Pelagibacter ubique]